ncbi:restriction endonuclease subunit S [Pseudomonas extremaustralis]|uniref:restriction endonuclease subunit S n=1 Tax=Pseudomonas extremaustralis TaxID=359110 RepID=UPI002AA0E147|nr:restriction endonuclease subunit S [Pseudomonas extremaustralis]
METAYPTYESYKASGHDWISVVPSHWSVEKLGANLRTVSEKNRPDLPLLSITREKGVIERDLDDEESNHNFIPDDLSGYKVLRTGQFGMNKMKAWQGSYGVSQHTGIVSPAYFIFDFTKEVDPDFFNRAIRSKLYVSFFGSASDGVRIGQWDLNRSRMREIPLLVPPLPEQRAIAAFLDEKCAKIDEAVKIKEDQIALLRERRQIIIQNAVTRGLNPTVPMKDSCIDWIGQIPAHWELKKAAWYFAARKGSNAAELTKEFCGKFPGQFAVYSGQTENEGVLGRIDNFEFDLREQGCMLCSTVGAKAMTIRYLQERFSLSQNCMIITPRDSILNMEFFSHAFAPIFAYFRNLIPDHMQASFRMEDFYQMKFLLPPVVEQIEILAFIRKMQAKLDGGIAIKEHQIVALNEYKISLINAAVTGKIKVI